MRKKFANLILLAVIVTFLVSCSTANPVGTTGPVSTTDPVDTTVSTEDHETPAAVTVTANELKVGDYVQMGTYLGVPILWRCVDIDENGPLMLSDKILCYKSYDPCAWDIKEKHGRGNEWSRSTLRCWLNSIDGAGDINWPCGTVPSRPDVSSESYGNEAGFFTGFIVKELGAAKLVSNGKEMDRMFLLSIDQFKRVKANAYILGDDFILGTPVNGAIERMLSSDAEMYTDLAILSYEDGEEAGEPYITPENIRNDDNKGCYWLRDTAELNGLPSIAAVDSWGEIYTSYAYSYGNFGVRPAFYISRDTEFSGGNGTETAPYHILVK